jgi:hypothetical protein
VVPITNEGLRVGSDLTRAYLPVRVPRGPPALPQKGGYVLHSGPNKELVVAVVNLDADGKRNDGRRSTFTNRGPGSAYQKGLIPYVPGAKHD